MQMHRWKWSLITPNIRLYFLFISPEKLKQQIKLFLSQNRWLMNAITWIELKQMEHFFDLVVDFHNLHRVCLRQICLQLRKHQMWFVCGNFVCWIERSAQYPKINIRSMLFWYTHALNWKQQRHQTYTDNWSTSPLGPLRTISRLFVFILFALFNECECKWALTNTINCKCNEEL